MEMANIKIIDYVNLGQLEISFSQIYSRIIDGVIIRGVFNKDECLEINKIIQNHKELSEQAKGYYVYPPTCFFPDFLNDLQKLYFEKSNQHTASIDYLFSFDFRPRIFNLLKKLAKDRSISELYGPDKKNNFLYGNFRVMYSETGNGATSNIHTGHALTKRSKDFAYSHLMGNIDFDNQLSYFLLSQNSKSGGEISIYNFSFDDYPNVSQNGVFYDINNNPTYSTAKDFKSYRLEPGDMIFFSGGRLYHRVEVVEGDIPRITFGGFVASDFKQNDLYYWI